MIYDTDICNNCMCVEVCEIAGNYPIDDCEHFKNKADFEEVVRCKDCKCHYYETVLLRDEIQHFCSRINKQVFSDFYCAYGERKQKNDLRSESMKRILLIVCCLSILLTGCVKVEKVEEKEEKDTSMFVEVEESIRWEIVYHKDSKVMYAVSRGGSNVGTFTLLVNPDGTPMIYEGE